MCFLSSVFRKPKSKNPEDFYKITITKEFVQVRYRKNEPSRIYWENINRISLITTNERPWLPDVFLELLGERSGCRIPQGTGKFDEVYEIVSKYKDFNFESVTKSMTCTENKEFLLWENKHIA